MFQKNGKLYIAAECIYTTFDWLLDLRLNNKSKPLKHTTTRVKIKNFKLIFFNNSFLRYKSKYPLRKTYSYSEFFWSVFSRIQIEYRETQSISPYSARMRENMDQEKFEHRHFLRSAVSYRFQKKKKKSKSPSQNWQNLPWSKPSRTALFDLTLSLNFAETRQVKWRFVYVISSIEKVIALWTIWKNFQEFLSEIISEILHSPVQTFLQIFEMKDIVFSNLSLYSYSYAKYEWISKKKKELNQLFMSKHKV